MIGPESTREYSPSDVVRLYRETGEVWSDTNLPANMDACTGRWTWAARCRTCGRDYRLTNNTLKTYAWRVYHLEFKTAASNPALSALDVSYL